MYNVALGILANMIGKVGYSVCVTYAAIYFDNPKLLWWYILVLLIGYDIETYRESKKNKESGDKDDDCISSGKE